MSTTILYITSYENSCVLFKNWLVGPDRPDEWKATLLLSFCRVGHKTNPAPLYINNGSTPFTILWQKAKYWVQKNIQLMYFILWAVLSSPKRFPTFTQAVKNFIKAPIFLPIRTYDSRDAFPKPQDLLGVCWLNQTRLQLADTWKTKCDSEFRK